MRRRCLLHFLLSLLFITPARCEGNVAERGAISDLPSPYHRVHRGARSSKPSKKKSKSSKKKGPKASKKKGKSGGKGGGKGSSSRSYSGDSESLDMPTSSLAPSPAPTCLECDDFPYVQSSRVHFLSFRGDKTPPTRSDTIRRIVFFGSLLVLCTFFGILLLLQPSSSRQRQQEDNGILQATKCYEDNLDEITVMEDDWVAERTLL